MKDRTPTQVLSNGAIRYEEFDSSEASQGYKYLKLADEPTEDGTPINKAFGDASFFVVYAHERSGTNNNLTNADGGNNIKFVATDAYVAGDTFSVNETQCIARTTDGAALPDAYFTNGAVVNCFKSGTALYFPVTAYAAAHTQGLFAEETRIDTVDGALQNIVKFINVI